VAPISGLQVQFRLFDMGSPALGGKTIHIVLGVTHVAGAAGPKAVQ